MEKIKHWAVLILLYYCFFDFFFCADETLEEILRNGVKHQLQEIPK